jgi:CheY-like chemotaxis protein
VQPPAALVPGTARVLVVDDEPAVRQLSSRMLQRLGYVAEAAAEGAEALQRIEARTPDLVLADVMMPGMDGRELRERLLAIRPELPVVLMSGHPAAEQLRSDLNGAQEFWLEKPFTISVLAATLREALAARVPEG